MMKVSEWVVAVDCRSQQVYALEGSPDALAEFNSLIKQVGVRVTSAEIATDVFSFFSKVVYGQRFQSQIIRDEMHLESLALQDFGLGVPTERKRRSFERWWKGVSAATRKDLTRPQAVRSEDGFAVQYFHYSRGNIYRAGVIVKADGTVVEGKSVLLTRRGM